MLTKFEVAAVKDGDDGPEYRPSYPIWINPAYVAAVYDHTIVMVDGHKTRVVEELPQILAKIR